MNDTELDDMLNQWEAPEVPARLRDSIVLPRPPKRRIAWPSWHLSKGLLAGAAVGAAMCFIGIAAAFPMALVSTPRFTLFSELIEYRDDGTSKIQEYRASTAQNGQVTVLERNNPDNWMLNMHFHFFDTIHRVLGLDHKPYVSVGSDCSVPGLSIVGHETILNYQTTVQNAVREDGSRYTEWRAPQLDCIVIKYTREEPANGKMKLTDEFRPLTVRINRAQ